MNTVRWTPAVLLVAVVVSLGLVIVAPWKPSDDGEGRGSPPPSAGSPSTSPSSSPTVQPTPVEELRATSFVGPAYDRNVVSDPTQPTSQARLWFQDGSWWAVMASAEASTISIHELNWESQRWVDTGVPVDFRPFARLDAVWTGETLYVVAAGTHNSASHALRVSRYTYDAAARRYVLAADSPRSLTATGVEDPTLAMSSDGQVWLTYVWSRALYASHTTGDGATWAAPFAVPMPDDSAERAAIVATGDGVAIAWTGLETDRLHVTSHSDGDADDLWADASTEVEGLAYGPDELSARATADGTVLAVVRTSLDSVENRNLDAPQLVLVRRDGADWTQSVVARVRDGHSGPSLLVDDERGDVYVFAEADGGIYAKRADLDSLSFVTGRGVLAIEPTDPVPLAPPSPDASGASAAPLVSRLSGTTSTRQPLGGLGEIVILAADDASGHFGHAVIPLPGGREAPATAQGDGGPLPDGVVEGLPPGALAYVFRDGFTSFAPGPASGTGWQTRSEPADTLVTIVEPTAGDPSLRVGSGADRQGARACKAMGTATSGIVVVQAAVQVRGTPDGDATVTALRSDGTEVASVRFGGEGTLRYFDGDERVNTAIAFTPGAWYESVVTVDLDAQTYSWRLTPLGGSAPIIAIDGLPLRAPAPLVDEVCVDAADAAGAEATATLVDDVQVAIGPGG